MKKQLSVVLVFILCFGTAACASETETAFEEIESGLERLGDVETLSYEYVTEITNENGTGSIGHVVEMNRNTGDYTYIMSVDGVPVSENRRENGMSYWKVNGEWNETDGTVRIEITLNDAALRQRESDIRQAGEDAVKAMEEQGISDELTDAQRELNEFHQNIRFIGESRHYVIDENGILTEYREILEYMDNGAAEHSETVFRFNQ